MFKRLHKNSDNLVLPEKYKAYRNALNRFKKSYDLPLDLLQYRRENSAEYL